MSGGFQRQSVHVRRVESPTTHTQATSQQGQLSSRDGPAAKDRRCQHRQEGNCLFYSQDQRLETERPKGAGTNADSPMATRMTGGQPSHLVIPALQQGHPVIEADETLRADLGVCVCNVHTHACKYECGGQCGHQMSFLADFHLIF